MSNPTPRAVFDESAAEVRDELAAICRKLGANPAELIGAAVRRAIDEVVDGPRTGRWSIEQLEKTEKTYIGTKVEILVRNALNLDRQGPLDTWISGYAVDIKWSKSSAWQIPTEAVNQLCLVVGIRNEALSAGVVWCRAEWLNEGQNKDGKKTLSEEGRGQIAWLFNGAPLPRNFLADIDEPDRTFIMSGRSGQERIRRLFMTCKEVPVPRSAIETVAQQKDPMKRVRADKRSDRLGGIVVLSGRYNNDEIIRLGLAPIRSDEFLGVLRERLTSAGFEI